MKFVGVLMKSVAALGSLFVLVLVINGIIILCKGVRTFVFERYGKLQSEEWSAIWEIIAIVIAAFCLLVGRDFVKSRFKKPPVE